MIQTKQFSVTGSAGKTMLADCSYDDQQTIKGTILFVHGFKGFKDWGAHHLSAAFFAENGYRFVKFNLSHSGVADNRFNDITNIETFATNTISKEMADLDTMLDHIVEEYPSDPIGLIGHSRGGGLAILQAAKDNRISKLITWSAISDFSSLWKKEQEAEWEEKGTIEVINARTKEKMPLNVTLLRDYRAHQDEYDIISAAKKIRIPWLILHGDQDVNVNFKVAQQLAQAQPSAIIHKIEGANHVYGASHPYTERDLPAQLKEVCEQSLQHLKEPTIK
jgi:pimeloyl-ACP methyl ester carboxylesterase